MDGDESKAISAKTRTRTEETIIKDGYMNGAADGQTSTYQSSFDLGYEQGLRFGIESGLHDSYMRYSNAATFDTHIKNTQNMNCQICAANATPQQNIVNLFNIQKESNELLVKTRNNR